jgi:hypothetical protein
MPKKTKDFFFDNKRKLFDNYIYVKDILLIAKVGEEQYKS